MKKVLYTWACLGLFTTQAIAYNPTNAGTPAEKTEATKNLVELIPDSQLSVSSDDNPDLLKIVLKGDVDNLTWIIFQPKGKVISRLETSEKIDEIKIANLEKGDYILMLKDNEGRMLYSPFSKS